MNVDVFGRRLGKVDSHHKEYLPGIAYKLTQDGQLDIENKRICNLANASDSLDAVNLKTLINYTKTIEKTFQEQLKKLKSELDDLKSFQLKLDNEVQKKAIDLSELVENHRDDIDKQLLETNATLNNVKQGLDAIYLGHLVNQS